MFFLDKISFPSEAVHFGLYHVLHILKAIAPADNLSYQERIFEHPARRQIFAHTVGRIYVNSILQCVIDIHYTWKDYTIKSVLCFWLFLLGTIVVCFLQKVWRVERYHQGPSVHWCPWIVLQLQGPVVWHLVCFLLVQLDMGGLGMLNWLFCYVRLSDDVDDPSFWYPRPKDGRVSVIIIR